MQLSELDYLRNNKTRLYNLLLEQKRREGRNNLHFLCKEVLGYTDLTDIKGFHGEYCEHLQNEEYNFKLTLTPRGTLKSSIGTIGGSLQDIIKDPDTRGLIASEKFTISTKFLAEIKGHLEHNDEFKKLYGELKSDQKWTESEIIVKTRTKYRKEPTISCAGIDVTKVGMHYDWIRVDDPHSDQNTTSQEQIDKVIRWYKLLLSLLDPGGRIYITGTIWHYGDLYNHIINKERERVEAGRNKRYKFFKRDSFQGTTDDLINDRITDDKLLWPERLTAEFLKDQYIEQGPYIFSCQYRLNPVDDENAIFKRSWMKCIDPSQLPTRLKYFAAVDPMGVDGEGKDYLAIPIVGVDKDWNCYIIDCIRKKADEHETVETMDDINQAYKLTKIGFESTSFQESYYKYVKLLQFQSGYRLPISEIKNSTKVTKKQRIKALVPWIKAGLFIFVIKDGNLDNAQGGMAALIDELTRYPKTTNDDCADGLAMINKLTERPSILHVLRKQNPNTLFAIRERYLKKKRDKDKHRLGARNVRQV